MLRWLLVVSLLLASCYDWEDARAVYCAQQVEFSCDGGTSPDGG